MKILLYIATVICALLAVYYFVPGIYHVFASGDAYARHYKHVVLFFILAVICVAATRVIGKAPHNPTQSRTASV